MQKQIEVLSILNIYVTIYVTECIVCVQGHDPLTFLSYSILSFLLNVLRFFPVVLSLFLTGWELYGPNYLKC